VKEATVKKRAAEVVTIEKAAADRAVADKATIDKAATFKAAMNTVPTGKSIADERAAEEVGAKKNVAVRMAEESIVESADPDFTHQEILVIKRLHHQAGGGPQCAFACHQ
jgi:hypothetical protein